MNKKTITYCFIAVLILFILFASFKLIIEPIRVKKDIKQQDKTTSVIINEKELNVIYYQGEEVDINITYGNIGEKIINVKNNNDEDIVYSLKFIDSSISNDLITYDVFTQYNNESYNNILKNQKLLINSSLIHNIVIPKKSEMNIKVVFKSNMENTETIIKGKLVVATNLSMLELFNLTINNITEALDKRIDDLNGITVKGYYILELKDLTFTNEANVSGYVLVDTTDISNIKYTYTIYNDKYLIKNSLSNDINIINLDNEYISSLNRDVICYQYDTRIKCNNFTNIPKNKTNNKKEYYNKVKGIISDYLNNYNKDDNKNYIYTINTNGIIGYILKNNNDMFLYLRNDMFMISGYNYKKLGEFTINSSTIRTYNESAFNLSASDKNKVCSFSGFNECYDENGNRI